MEDVWFCLCRNEGFPAILSFPAGDIPHAMLLLLEWKHSLLSFGTQSFKNGTGISRPLLPFDFPLDLQLDLPLVLLTSLLTRQISQSIQQRR